MSWTPRKYSGEDGRERPNFAEPSVNSFPMIRPEQERVRLESLAQLRALGIDPYPAAAYPVDTHAAPLCADFAADREVCLAGRILSRRIMGKASFAELQDATGKIQIYLNRDELCPGRTRRCTTPSSRSCSTAGTSSG